MGGELARSDREKMISAVKSYLREFAKLSTTSTIEIEKGIDFDSEFKRLIGDLSDLVISVVEHYPQAVYLPRMLDELAFQVARKPEQAARIEKVALPDLSQTDWKYAAKLTRDLLIFLQRIGALPSMESLM